MLGGSSVLQLETDNCKTYKEMYQEECLANLKTLFCRIGGNGNKTNIHKKPSPSVIFSVTENVERITENKISDITPLNPGYLLDELNPLSCNFITHTPIPQKVISAQDYICQPLSETQIQIKTNLTIPKDKNNYLLTPDHKNMVKRGLIVESENFNHNILRIRYINSRPVIIYKNSTIGLLQVKRKSRMSNVESLHH